MSVKWVKQLKADRIVQLNQKQLQDKMEAEQRERDKLEKTKSELMQLLEGDGTALIVKYYVGMNDGYYIFHVPSHDAVYMTWTKEKRKLRENCKEYPNWFTQYECRDDRETYYTKHDCLADALIEAEKLIKKP